MTFPLFLAPEIEASRRLAYTANAIDRQSENRSDDSVATALADPRTRLMLIRDGRVWLKKNEAGFDPWYKRAEAEALSAHLGAAVLLGWDERGPVVAATGGIDAEALPPEVKAIDYRSVTVQGLIDPAALGALAQAGALSAWHATHAFCGRCGKPTEMRAGGYKRVCTGCNAEHFPRTDPVAIMLTISGDRCLMGRGPHFPPGMYSALAGFIEPGETIEAAVRRETFEEAGIRLGRVTYFASQPWPFPFSLMIGCYGEALNDDIRFDAKELQDCRWFSRDEVLAAFAGNHPDSVFVPPKTAVAHHLIRNWVEMA